jgi:hypothetical protein
MYPLSKIMEHIGRSTKMKWVRCIKKQSYISEGKVYKVLESYNTRKGK